MRIHYVDSFEPVAARVTHRPPARQVDATSTIASILFVEIGRQKPSQHRHRRDTRSKFHASRNHHRGNTVSTGPNGENELKFCVHWCRQQMASFTTVVDSVCMCFVLCWKWERARVNDDDEETTETQAMPRHLTPIPFCFVYLFRFRHFSFRFALCVAHHFRWRAISCGKIERHTQNTNIDRAVCSVTTWCARRADRAERLRRERRYE